jgi:predicted nucleic acid-binding protein
LIALDTSAVVALFATWHEGHSAVAAALRDEADVRLPGHVAFEAYSVLIRLPPPHRISPAPVLAFLDRRFHLPWLELDADGQRELLREAADLRLTGGAIYDALIAATARGAGARLLSRDRRAAPVYRALGVDHRLLF